jgi:acyl-CoA synthetase (NDP forming)
MGGANRRQGQFAMRGTKEQLRSFFEPDGVMIVGASRTEGRPGYCAVENLVRLGYSGRIYPVNPEADEILGLKAFPDIESIPDGVEFAAVLAPASEVMGLVPKLASKGVKAVTLVSGGFSEYSRQGAILESQIVGAARKAGIRIAGPNAVGPINSSNNLSIFLSHMSPLKKGAIALVAQTGQVCSYVVEWLDSFLRQGVSKVIDPGNKADIDDSEVVEYLADDPETKVIALHIEGMKNGRKFLEVARRASRKKPIVCYKSGWSEEGSRAAASHTGSMMGNKEVIDAALKQSGVIRVRDMDSFLEFSKAFACLRPPRGNRVGIVTVSGGSGVMAIDTCVEVGLQRAEFSQETRRRLGKIQPPDLEVSNPFDVGKASVVLYGPDMAFKEATQALIDDENTDCVLLVLGAAQSKVVYGTNPEVFTEVRNEHNKPVVAVLMSTNLELVWEQATILEANGMPVYSWPERAVRALGALHKYGLYLSRSR